MAFDVMTGTQILEEVKDSGIHATDEALARQAELAEVIQHRMVGVDPSSPCCCIDGRYCVLTLKGEPSEPRPSMAGGLTTAYAAAEMTGWFTEDALSDPTQRFTLLKQHLETREIYGGNHVDDTHVDADFTDGTTGCGAADKFLANIANIYDYPTVVRTYGAALVDNYQPGLQQLNKESVLTRNQAWNPVATKNVFDPHAVEVLHDDDRGVHGHREYSVLFNYVHDTTLDRDGFVHETDEQIFVVDMWYIDKVARAMSGEGDTGTQYQALRQAMVEYQIGTYLSLCDGSQTYTVLKPAA